MRATSGSDHFRVGMLFAVASAFTFGMSGSLAKSLIEAGWSPTAAVVARLAGGALALAAVATVIRPGWFQEARQHAGTVVLYGLIPIAGSQLCFFNAVAHLSVGVALLLEYTSPVLVVGWFWATTRLRPGTLTLGGVALAVAGITLVLGLIGPHGPSNASVNLIGIGWGLGAAVCAVCYFVMSDKASADGTGLHSITLATGGLIIGAVAVGLFAATGAMPMTFTGQNAVFAHATVPWIVPVIALAIIPTALAYTLGVMAIARLQPRFASLVGLAEVMFAVLTAWALLGEAITPTQALGGAVVLAGLALARLGDRSERPTEPSTQQEPTPPQASADAQTIGRG